jgi:anti-sigma regulatory factor (Ser/Thr protein kinase)
VNHSRVFAAQPGSIRAARAYVEGALADIELPALQSIVLMVSELATNSVRHAGSEFTVDIRAAGDAVRVAITDRGSGEPEMRAPTSDAPSGRGLRIVDRLADEWGIGDGSAGTSVWFVVRVDAKRRDDPEHEHVRAARPPDPKEVVPAERTRDEQRNQTDLSVAA